MLDRESQLRGPAGRAAAHLDGKAAYRETPCRQAFQVVQLLDVAVADLPAGLVAFPDEARVAARGIFRLGVDEGRIPAPAVGAGDTHAALEQIKRRLATHAAALCDVIGAPIGGACAGVHQHDLERREVVAYAVELGCHIARGNHIAIGEMAKVELDAGLQAPLERHLVDRDRPAAPVHGGREMPGRIELSGIMG